MRHFELYRIWYLSYLNWCNSKLLHCKFLVLIPIQILKLFLIIWMFVWCINVCIIHTHSNVWLCVFVYLCASACVCTCTLYTHTCGICMSALVCVQSVFMQVHTGLYVYMLCVYMYAHRYLFLCLVAVSVYYMCILMCMYEF